jgi:hypothetical protein
VKPINQQRSRIFMGLTVFNPHRWCLHLIVVMGFECS